MECMARKLNKLTINQLLKSLMYLLFALALIFGVDEDLSEFLPIESFYFSFCFEFFLIFLYFLININKKITIDRKYFIIFIFYFIPFVYSCIVIYLYSNDFFSYLSRNISTFLWTFLAITSSYVLFSVDKRKSLDFVFYVLIALNLFYFVSAFLKFGFSETIHSFLSFNFNDNEVFGFLEKHQLTFCLSLFFIYYLFKGKSFLKLLVCTFFLLLGFKRIIFVGIFLVIVFYLFTKKMKKYRTINSFIFFVSIIGVCFGFVFIYLLKSNLLYEILDRFNIDTSGRILMYKEMEQVYTFNFSFLGHGRGFTTRYFETKFALVGQNAASVHSDILTLYIDLGFVGFGLYSISFLYLVPKRVFKFGINSNLKLLSAIALFTFFLFFTDNTLTYYVYIFVYSLICYNGR